MSGLLGFDNSSPYENNGYFNYGLDPYRDFPHRQFLNKPPALENVKYYPQDGSLKEPSKEQVASLASKVGKLYKDHKNDRITPLTTERARRGFVAVYGGTVGIYLLTSLTIGLPAVFFWGAVILGIGSLITSFVAFKRFSASRDKLDYHNPALRNQIFEKFKKDNTSLLTSHISVKDLIEYDLLDKMLVSANPEEKARFYLTVKKFIEEYAGISISHERKLQYAENEYKVSSSLNTFYADEGILQETTSWKTWYKEQVALYNTAFIESIDGIQSDFQKVLSTYLKEANPS